MVSNEYWSNTTASNHRKYSVHSPPNNARFNETQLIVDRINSCLASTNMLTYFQQMGFYKTAQENAGLVLKALRKIIPRFSMRYELPCWNASFQAKRLRFNNHAFVRGSIGNLNFTQHPTISAHNVVLNSVKWGSENTFTSSIVCLPKIFLLGYAKCGSTFLYCLLHKILELTKYSEGSCQVQKEPHWWVLPGARNLLQPLSPDYAALYLLNFASGVKYVEKSLPALTIDASPNLMFHWPRYTEEETMENYCLLPALIPVILPDSKYFVIMRNPISALYSAFWFSCTRFVDLKLSPSAIDAGPDIFHDRITTKIALFNQCKQQGKPLDKCVDVIADNMYTPEMPSCGRTRLEMVLYYVHTRKWLSVIPREQIYFLTLEELIGNDLKKTARDVLSFLDLDPAPLKQFNALNIQCAKNQQQTLDYKNDHKLMMRNDTRQILEKFLEPYNRMLADLLGDDKFLWK